MSSQRMLRVNELLKREIANLLERVDFRLDNCLVSVSAADVSPDLRHAKIHISVFGGDDEINRQVMKFLINNRGSLQKKIAKDIALKYTPVLKFILDGTMEKGDRIMSILDDIGEGEGEGEEEGKGESESGVTE